MRAIRTATICHSQDDHRDSNHRRVKLELLKIDGGYQWTSSGEDCGLPTAKTVTDAEGYAISAWGSSVWALKARWA